MSILARIKEEIETEQENIDIGPIKDKMRELALAKKIVKSLKKDLKKLIEDAQESEEDNIELLTELGLNPKDIDPENED